MKGLIISKAELDSGKYRLSSRLAVRVSGDVVDDVGGAAIPVYVVHDEELDSRQFRIAPGRVQPIIAAKSVAKLHGRAVTPVYVVSGTLGEVAWTPNKGIIGSNKHPIAWYDFTTLPYPGALIHWYEGLSQPSALLAPWRDCDGLYFSANASMQLPDRLYDTAAAIRFSDGSFDVAFVKDELFMPGQSIKVIAFYDSLTDSEIESLTRSL